MKQSWRKEKYVNCCYGKRTRREWWRIGIWKMRKIREGFEKEGCLLSYEEEDNKHMLITCPDTTK
jgi:hypothetical protein